ncbi:hypothetical protein EDC96DRAFT_591458 [Choanephora cucurbitarum]|nr:hypothetical protein EDC96DRAFT_591458 [Choanephora cucurbitarum]
MQTPTINKNKLSKHIVEINNSPLSNAVDEEYSSYLTTCQGLNLDGKKIVDDDVIVTTYDADTNGWCGYCSLYFGCVWDDELMANHGGSGVRFQLLNVLEEHFDLFDNFFTTCYQPFGIQDTSAKLKKPLSMVPDETDEWWLTAQDSIWVAVLTFKVSIAVYCKAEGVVLYKHKNPVFDLPICLLELKQDHFLCHILPCWPLDYTCHPFQPTFDSIFSTIL